MSYVRTAQRAIEASFKGPLKEFLKEVTFEYFESDGEYDAENDTRTPVYNPRITKEVPVLRSTVEDMNNHGVESNTSKIIVPGHYLPKELQASDRVMIGQVQAPISKTVGVPGEVVYILFVKIT
ncbi:head-tail connector [Citromicrobium phage vB_CbaS-RXM]|nr:head-tail connector [Citromicrobium phage vB_CbaS-RXM]